MSCNVDFSIPLNVITKIINDLTDVPLEVEKDFIQALSRATSLFILYSTTRANEVASECNRRTVHSQDVLNAINSLGFEHMVPELIKWHSVYIEEKESIKSKKKKSTEENATQDSNAKISESTTVECHQ